MSYFRSYAQRGSLMALEFRSRASDSLLVHQVGCAIASSDSTFVAVPDGSWGLVVFRSERQTRAYLTGSTTRPVQVSLKAGDEILSVSFKSSVYSPNVSPQT